MSLSRAILRAFAATLLAGQSLFAQGSTVYVQGVVLEKGTLAPGPPDSTQQPEFAMVFGQLALNAEQSRFVADSFPYAYRLQRVQRQIRGDSVVDVVAVDTLFVQTNRERWRYRPGNVVTGSIFTNSRAMYLPTLEDFASAEFQRNHCFARSSGESSPSRTSMP